MSPAPAPPTFRQAPSGPQEALLVKAGDKAVLNCETDSLPEPAVTWYKDGQPLALVQRTQAPLGGQRLEILDTQVSHPMARAATGGHPNVTSRSGWGQPMAVWQDVEAAASSAYETPNPVAQQPQGWVGAAGRAQGSIPGSALTHGMTV